MRSRVSWYNYWHVLCCKKNSLSLNLLCKRKIPQLSKFYTLKGGFMPHATTRREFPMKQIEPGEDSEFRMDELKPVHKNGNRNYFCPFYCKCLDYAIENSWYFWACFNCRYKTSKALNEVFLLSNEAYMSWYDLPSQFKINKNNMKRHLSDV